MKKVFILVIGILLSINLYANDSFCFEDFLIKQSFYEVTSKIQQEYGSKLNRINEKYFETNYFYTDNYKKKYVLGFADIVQRSSTIDVIWFNQRNMPDSFFEVEHSTDIQNSLLKFEDLIDFSARMFIVADAVRKDEYLKKMNYDAFKILKDNKRVDFLSYEDLDKQYNFEISKQEIQTIL